MRWPCQLALAAARKVPFQQVPWRRREPLPAPRHPAIDVPRQELHLHFHGASAEDVSAIVARVNRDRG